MYRHRETQTEWAQCDCADTADAGLLLGAHLVTQRRGYVHHGIYVGEGKVIHYAGFSRCMHPGPVELISVAGFASGFAVYVRRYRCTTYAGDEVAHRAGSRLGENDYRLLSNNCEHFCSWCLFGECRSEQVDACLRNPLLALLALRAVTSVLIARLARECKPMLTRLQAA
ncbi:lecithin retinol acyltransferase family protein [Ralstonia solanacearum]|uniref:lecithin retinol acyltransferase family protein n=1 Tax=Ralstonia solanacearum TaxID=305 RepID=UPI0007C8BFE2|nr:lecithin retinol acyltransferase family protein [Ralstonia solanacearum]